MVPWIEVLLHTLIDWMRTEEAEGESRKVNHSLFVITQITEKCNITFVLYRSTTMASPSLSAMAI